MLDIPRVIPTGMIVSGDRDCSAKKEHIRNEKSWIELDWGCSRSVLFKRAEAEKPLKSKSFLITSPMELQRFLDWSPVGFHTDSTASEYTWSVIDYGHRWRESATRHNALAIHWGRKCFFASSTSPTQFSDYSQVRSHRMLWFTKLGPIGTCDISKDLD